MPARLPLTRRQFVGSAVAATAATVAPLSISRSAHAAGSDTIRLGLVGCGGRGAGAASDALGLGPGTRLVAVADAFEDRALGAARNLSEKFKSQVDVPRERVFVGFDGYQRVLQSGIDLVLLATPPGFRPLHFEAAVQAGKHVFLEKPMAVDAPGYRKLLSANELAKKKSLKVGSGLQHRYDAGYAETIRRIQDGAIGSVRTMEAFWRAGGVWVRARKPGQSEMQYQMTNWYYFVWLCGDFIAEQLVHNLDICQWIKGGHPERARGSGGRQERFGPDHGEIFDHFKIEYTYADGTRLLAECCHLQSAQKGVGEKITGTLGTATPSGTIEGQTKWKFSGQRPNPHQAEHAALLDAIRRDLPHNETEYSATSSMMSILGRMAAYDGREVTWDEAIRSQEAFVPERYAWDADPPTLPDKFGDYEVPARSKRRLA
jgi:myo-inositol 2-dehydrogenase / D-chiro-inositol 1-dehydrogenase